MSIQRLRTVLKVPTHPLAVGNANRWQSFEEELGGILPADYKEFISCYGSGCIDGFLWIYNPFATNKNLNLLSQAKAVLHSFEILRDEFGEELPFPLFPAPNGVLPCGSTDNGDHLLWRFVDGRLQSPLMVMESRGPERQEYDLSMTDFLADVLTRRILVKVFPPEFPSMTATFVPKD
jgi:hypothetical protein